MLDWLLQLDTDVFLWLNAWHTPFLDNVMFAISRTDIWIPLYLVFIIHIYWHFKHRTLKILILVCLVIVGADAFTSRLMKPYFKRLRPSHEAGLQNKIHTVYDYKGGQYGFASSHAANTFGLATIMLLVFGSQAAYYRWLFLWAGIVSYSRIYLGVHYPLDIIVGGLVGVSMAWLWFSLFRYIGYGVLQNK